MMSTHIAMPVLIPQVEFTRRPENSMITSKPRTRLVYAIT